MKVKVLKIYSFPLPQDFSETSSASSDNYFRVKSRVSYLKLHCKTGPKAEGHIVGARSQRKR